MNAILQDRDIALRKKGVKISAKKTFGVFFAPIFIIIKKSKIGALRHCDLRALLSLSCRLH